MGIASYLSSGQQNSLMSSFTQRVTLTTLKKLASYWVSYWYSFWIMIFRALSVVYQYNGSQVTAAETLEGAQEAILKWRFDSAGAPCELLERIIACCHVIGEVEIFSHRLKLIISTLINHFSQDSRLVLRTIRDNLFLDKIFPTRKPVSSNLFYPSCSGDRVWYILRVL